MTMQVLDALFGALRPKAPILPADFAEQTIVLPASTTARAGPLRLTKYQRDALNILAEPGVNALVLRWASQTMRCARQFLTLGSMRRRGRRCKRTSTSFSSSKTCST